MRELRIGRDDAGQRLDRFVRKCLPASTLGNVFRLLRKGVVRVNGRRAEGDVRLSEGDVVQIRLADEALGDLGHRSGRSAEGGRERGAEPGPARRRSAPPTVLYRDEHVLAVDKPPFLLVQPGEGRPAGDDPTLQDLVLDLVGPGDAHTFRPALAHRLDRATSGVVLFGLSGPGLRGLTRLFRARQVEKRYLALVEGDPASDGFSVDLPLARDPSDESRGKRVKVSRGDEAQKALTDFAVVARNADRTLALVEARPVTGRTHQIRVHLRAVRLPIAGDPTYGDPRTRAAWAERGLRRQWLHAWRVRLPHPVVEGAVVEVEAPLPPDLRRALGRCGMASAVPL